MSDDTPTFIISAPYKGTDGQWYFNVKGLNGEIVLQSEGYTTRAMARKTIGRLADADVEAMADDDE